MDNLMIKYNSFKSTDTLLKGHVYYYYLQFNKKAIEVAKKFNTSSLNVTNLANKVKIIKGKNITRSTGKLITLFEQPFISEEKTPAIDSRMNEEGVDPKNKNGEQSGIEMLSTINIQKGRMDDLIKLPVGCQRCATRTTMHSIQIENMSRTIRNLRNSLKEKNRYIRELNSHYQVKRVNQREKRFKQTIEKLKSKNKSFNLKRKPEDLNEVLVKKAKKQKKDIKNYYKRKNTELRNKLNTMVTELGNNNKTEEMPIRSTMLHVTKQQRCLGAIVGSVVGDASARPLHWIYNSKDLEKAIAEERTVEFAANSNCPFYTLPTGSNSCYGDQMLTLLRSLVAQSGFNKSDYEQRLVLRFGEGTLYDITKTVGHDVTKDDWPISGPWLHGSLKTFLKEKRNGNLKTGADDKHSDGIAKVAPLVVLYSEEEVLLSKVEEVVRVTQENDLAVKCAQAGSLILREAIHGTPPEQILRIVQSKVDPEIASYIQSALDHRSKTHKDAVKEFGSDCGLPHNFQNICHQIARHPESSYVEALRSTIRAGGDNCSRSCFLGAYYGAIYGMSGGIPQEWIDKTTNGPEAIELAKLLVS